MPVPFRDWVRGLRSRKNLSQEDFARAVGVSQATVSQWEKGRNHPTYGNLLALAEIAQVTFADIDHYLKPAGVMSEIDELDPASENKRSRLGTKILLIPEGRLNELESYMEFLIEQGERENENSGTKDDAPKTGGASEEGAANSIGQAG